ELLLGARLAASGGRRAWTRTALTALGVGLGVALLLLAAAVPDADRGRQQRELDRLDLPMGDLRPADNTLLIAYLGVLGDYDGGELRGRLLQPEGPRAPRPPGVARLPGVGEMVVSPQLREQLDAPDGRVLRELLPYRVVGEIGDGGLAGPAELAVYVGSDRLAASIPSGNGYGGNSGIWRVRDFGGRTGVSGGLDPVLSLLAFVVFAALLVPVAVFVGAAVRFGGEARDRRLATMRLVGADVSMARRIAAGESLLGALLGLVVGGLLFLLAGRLVEQLSVQGLSFFAGDLMPSPAFIVAVVVAVPLAAVGVTLLALRAVTIEPLGVARAARPRPRRLWWRLLLPLAGIGLLQPLIGRNLAEGGDTLRYVTTAGVVLLLIGIAALLPWLVEAVVRRLSGGGVAAQLAVRRLQLDSGTSARVVAGIAVAVAGAIALQTLFSGVERTYVVDTGVNPARAQFHGSLGPGRSALRPETVARRLEEGGGVRSLAVYDQAYLSARGAALTVAGCDVLRQLARIGRCREGDVFMVDDGSPLPRPGQRTRISNRDRWRIPATAQTVQPRPFADSGFGVGGVLATPAALHGIVPDDRQIVVSGTLDRRDPEAFEKLQISAGAIDPRFSVATLLSERVDRDFARMRRMTLGGAIAVLVLIGVSMLVGGLEQLRERRRLLAALVAAGTPRATLARSLLWQTAIPVALGLVLAIAIGSLLGAVLLQVVSEPVSFDFGAIAALTALGAGVVLLVTAATLPALRRLTRPDGLRTE
ncbi:FtsX-like permease family protein, partial [Conexibacter sp. JD483]|uniref:FtsX-like permease family protein n=2 Tax=Conexibacter TaxID=191494 RepID=UPI00287038C8